MAVITITEILGGDNLAGSRLTLNDNFKKLANAINTIEKRLDTSFNPGGSLNVGNALIRKYTNAATTQIFTCEASALFQGNLNVSLDLGVTKSINAGLDLNVSRNVLFDGAATGGGSFTSQVRSTFKHEFVNYQLNNGTTIAPTLDPQTLSGSTTTRNITSVIGYSVLRLDLSTYTGTGSTNCDTIVLPAVGTAGCTPGQILTVIIDTKATTAITGGFQIDKSTLATNSATPANIAIGVGAITTDLDEIYKLSVTLFADHNGWRVLNVTQPIADVVDAAITY